MLVDFKRLVLEAYVSNVVRDVFLKSDQYSSFL